MENSFFVIGIFVLSVVILFAVTKDRWNWKKIFKRSLIWGGGSIAVIMVGLYIYNKIEGMPKKQTEYMGIKLTDTMSDVKFKKGEPFELKSKDGSNIVMWFYNFDGSKINDLFDVVSESMEITWKNGKISTIGCSSTHYMCDSINNLKIDDGLDNMLKKLGKESKIVTADDNTTRTYLYDKYNSKYSLAKAKIWSLSVYNPEIADADIKKGAVFTITTSHK